LAFHENQTTSDDFRRESLQGMKKGLVLWSENFLVASLSRQIQTGVGKSGQAEKQQWDRMAQRRRWAQAGRNLRSILEQAKQVHAEGKRIEPKLGEGRQIKPCASVLSPSRISFSAGCGGLKVSPCHLQQLRPYSGQDTCYQRAY
jgi:hypothetical protein